MSDDLKDLIQRLKSVHDKYYPDSSIYSLQSQKTVL